ncbi:MAG TPA: enolase C-terminal domain-like protein [Galbitalea sp.]|jgi:L-alanine-DL-glutamate epimerase-like enolase superfamily enzyme|nr:enolase C-terminal domain-like protein [Galbitalea sp.]
MSGDDLRITDIRCHVLAWSESPETLQANLVSATTRYAHHGHTSNEWWGQSPLVVVEVETAGGIIGLGSCGGFTAVTANIIEQHFRQLVLGQSAYDRELIWDKLYRASVRFGRVGPALAAIAGIDIALHDAVGKALSVPVHTLLGGAVRDSIPAYVSRLYAYTDLDELQQEASRWIGEGFTAMKQRFGFGPEHGAEGKRRNEALIAAVREVVGEDVTLAADAYMGWDLPYTLDMVKRLEKYNLAWVEEPLLAMDLNGYEELCRRSPIPISHGEHLYNRYEFAEVLRRSAASIIQPDVNRVGGFTEAKKIIALAETYGIPVMPHSNEMHNLHLTFSSTAVPMAEYFPNVLPDTGNELFWSIFEGEIEAVDGQLSIPTAPGLGIRLNQDVLESLEIRR